MWFPIFRLWASLNNVISETGRTYLIYEIYVVVLFKHVDIPEDPIDIGPTLLPPPPTPRYTHKEAYCFYRNESNAWFTCMQGFKRMALAWSMSHNWGVQYCLQQLLISYGLFGVDIGKLGEDKCSLLCPLYPILSGGMYISRCHLVPSWLKVSINVSSRI